MVLQTCALIERFARKLIKVRSPWTAAFMRSENILCPDRITAMFLPGNWRPRASRDGAVERLNDATLS